MHRTKKLTVTAMAAALLMTGGVSTAMADPDEKVTICHRTRSVRNPYVLITVGKKAVDGEGRNDHTHHVDDKPWGDLIPAPTTNGVPYCPTGTTPDPQEPPVENDGDCIASSESGDSTTNQAGLVNVAALNGNAGSLRPNLLCGAEVVKNVNVLGEAIFGGDAAEAGDDCNEESTSGDSTTNQAGLVNIAALNGNAGSLLPNLACGADIVEDLNVLGFALGGSSLGGSLLGSELLVGPAGILTDAPGFLLSGLTADVRVLANVLVLL